MEQRMIRKIQLAFIILLVHINFNVAQAGNLQFPKTDKEIVDGLRMLDGKAIVEGVTYESIDGKVYKYVGGKRFRLRGLKIIATSDIVPKVAALINFDINSSEISSTSHALLDEFGKAFNGELVGINVLISGHTDNTGSEEYNKVLSIRRAKAVSKYLQERHSIPSTRLVVQGYGESQPISTNDTDDGRHLNRRVEFVRLE